MKVNRMGITEILRRVWLFSANKIMSSESVIKQITQVIVKLNLSLWQKLGTHVKTQRLMSMTIFIAVGCSYSSNTVETR